MEFFLFKFYMPINNDYATKIINNQSFNYSKKKYFVLEERQENALNIVAGYTIFNDVSARDVGRRTDWNFGMDWFRHKSFDTSAPMGPWIIPAKDISNPQNLNLKTTIGDQIMQEGNTNNMVFSIVELLISLTKQIPLKPGDVIATGTCAGVGVFREIFLKAGDTMLLEIEEIGVLSNPVV